MFFASPSGSLRAMMAELPGLFAMAGTVYKTARPPGST